MEFKYYILISIYLIFTIIVQVKLTKDDIFKPSQKRVHSILLWLIPILWGILVINALHASSRFTNRDKRKIHDSEYSDDYNKYLES